MVYKKLSVSFILDVGMEIDYKITYERNDKVGLHP
jgi:hypothetical protein